jgi:hypothetical protein
LAATLAGAFADALTVALTGALGLLAGAGFLAVTELLALGLATGAAAFLTTAVLATVLDLAGAWAGFFDF